MPPNKPSFFDKILPKLHRLDDSSLKTVVERLAAERSFLETLFHTIEDGVMVVNVKERIVFFNEASMRMLGFDREQAEDHSIRRFLPDIDWDRLMRLDREGGRQVQRHEIEVSYPRHRFLTLFVSPLDGSAVGSSGLVLILHDITEARKQTNEAIETERSQALTLLAASVAHEIGNPLNALSIHLQLVEREIAKLQKTKGRSSVKAATHGGSARTPVDRLQEYVEVAKGEILRLDYIVKDFLHALRPSKPLLRASSVNDVVGEALGLLRPELANRGIHVQEHLGEGLPEIQLDSGQIKQVLVNLIKNAMQAMTKDGQLTLRTSAASEGIVLSVEDTGGGIPPEQLNRIFEPYYTTKQKGSGLGLMIVQRIILEHRGRIGVESHVGKGTQFRVWLPLHEPRPRLLAQTT
ncbi:MAG: PAS domain S-box protein [Verrucomicrobia bacterium]|nr:PAS domain S-box protein [Verrucomicrobiota bacterium]MBI3870954.1 PAS domain S-box protein [Verrucomicrobiota bacterium]